MRLGRRDQDASALALCHLPQMSPTWNPATSSSSPGFSEAKLTQTIACVQGVQHNDVMCMAKGSQQYKQVQLAFV